MQQELLSKPQVSEIGEHIGIEAGEEMVKRFFDTHPDQSYMNVMGREIIEKILAQPNCKGIAIIPGYDSSNVRQAILVGIDENSTPILKYNIVNASGEFKDEEGLVADRGKTWSWWHL